MFLQGNPTYSHGIMVDISAFLRVDVVLVPPSMVAPPLPIMPKNAFQTGKTSP